MAARKRRGHLKGQVLAPKPLGSEGKSGIVFDPLSRECAFVRIIDSD